MKTKKFIQFPLYTIAGLVIAGCSVEKTQDGELPDVDVQADAGKLPEYEIVKTEEGEMPELDVDVEGGQLPKYDVDMADVDIGTTTETITVPKVKVVLEEEEVEVPYVDVSFDDEEMDQEDRQPRTLSIAARTGQSGQSLAIQEVFYADSELYVLAEVSGNASEAEQPSIIRDAISVNAPDMDINYYVIANEGAMLESVNKDFDIIASRNDIDVDWNNSKTLYTR